MPGIIPWSRRSSPRHRFVVALALALGVACTKEGAIGGISEDRADLVTTLTGPTQGTVGDVLSYSLEVRNDGPDDAASVIPTLTFAGGLAFASAGGGGTEAGGTITWPTLATLASGRQKIFHFKLSVSATGASSVAAAATSNTSDPKPDNSDGSGSGSRVEVQGTAPPTTADLQVLLAGTLSGGNGVTRTARITVVNGGPVPAQDVTVTLDIPDAVAATVTSAEPATRQNGKIVWALGVLAVNENRHLTVDVVIPLTSATAISASATSTTPDPVPANNDGSQAKATIRAVLAPLRTITGEANGDQFGWVTANLGDLTGDGVADFTSTAPTNSAGGAQAGRAYVYSGATGAELFRVTGQDAQGQLGFSIAIIGDVNADGTPDLAIGAPAINTGQTGYVLVISGSNGGQIRRINSPFAGDGFGYAVADLGDFNGDGVSDFLIGVPGRSPGGISSAGGVYVTSGASGSFLAFAPGTSAGGQLGAGVGGVGDVNGDGTPDFAAGARGEPGGGAIHLYSGADGSELVPAFSPPTGGHDIGQFWVNTPGDLDGDGTSDVFAVDFANGTNGALRGAAYVFSGATGNLIRQFLGESPGDQFGIGRGVGDITGDGRPDFILAGWQRSEVAAQAGKIYLVDGSDGTVLRSFVSVTQGETLGFDAIGLGDVNGDGLTDYLVTGGQGINQGKAYIVAGVPLP